MLHPLIARLSRLALLLACGGLGTGAGVPAVAADPHAWLGRWTSAEGDVIEFQIRERTAIGVLVATSPAGLGRFFPPGAPILSDVTWTDDRLACTLQHGQWKIADNPAAHTSDYVAIGGAAAFAAAGDASEIVLQWQPVQERHFRNEDGWHQRVERLPTQPPPVKLTLRREPRLTMLLVQGEELAPAVALFHGLPYVAEFTTRDLRLPLTINLVLTVGGERIPLEVAAISDGAERRYRSRPFLLRPKSEGLPLP